MNVNLIEIHQLAAFYEVDERTIQNWEEKFIEKKYGPTRVERGKYDFVKFARNIYKLLKEENEVAKQGIDESTYKLRKEFQIMHNEEKAIKLNLLKKNLANVNTLTQAFVTEIKMISHNLRSLKPRLNLKLNGTDETLKIISDEIDDMCRTISKSKLNLTEEFINDDEEQ